MAFSDARVDPTQVGTALDALERGGSVEVFATAADASTRGKRVQALLQGAGGVLGSEYDYTSGPVLVRVSGLLTPDQAALYRSALG